MAAISAKGIYHSAIFEKKCEQKKKGSSSGLQGEGLVADLLEHILRDSITVQRQMCLRAMFILKDSMLSLLERKIGRSRVDGLRLLDDVTFFEEVLKQQDHLKLFFDPRDRSQ